MNYYRYFLKAVFILTISACSLMFQPAVSNTAMTNTAHSQSLKQQEIAQAGLLTAQLRQGPASDSTFRTNSSTIQNIVHKRKELMLELIQESPNDFMRLALTDEDKINLPVEVQADFEQVFQEEGYIEILIEDQFTVSTTQYIFKTQDKRYTLHFAGQVPPINSQVNVRLKGVQLDDHLAVRAGDVIPVTTIDSFNVQSTTGSFARTASATSNTAAGTTGDQKTLVILVNLMDNPIEPYTVATAYNLMFNSPTGINAYYYENSLQQTTLSGTVLGWYTVPLNKNSCGSNPVIKEAIKKVDPIVHFPDYTRLVIMTLGCGSFAGQSTLGRVATMTDEGEVILSQAVINGGSSSGPDPFVIGHEYGHSLGVNHANSWDCGVAALSETGCSTAEYGDIFDVMGSSVSLRHVNAAHKDQLGWFLASDLITLENQTAGTYSLAPLETRTDRPIALKILKKVDLDGVRDWYYSEYRQPLGFDKSMAAQSFIHLGNDSGSKQTQLLDMTPGSTVGKADFSDGALAVSSTFTAPDGVSIKNINQDANGLTLQVVVPADTIAPRIGFSFLYGGSLYIGPSFGNFIDLEGSDNRGFSEVTLFKDTSLLATKTTPPFNYFYWNNNSEPEGVYQLKVRAVDTSNNVSESTIAVTIDRTAPRVEILSPGEADHVSGIVPVTISASDQGEIAVDLFSGTLDNLKYLGSAYNEPYTIQWDSRYTPDGLNTLYASAQDRAGNVAYSSPVQVSVFNTNHPPIISPIGNKEVNEGELLTFIVSATDPEGDPLSYFVENLPSGASFDSSSRTFNWMPGKGQAGKYSVTFRVFDGQLQSSQTIEIDVLKAVDDFIFIDNFLRSDSSNIGADWHVESGGFSIVSKELHNAAVQATHMALIPEITGTNQSAAVDFASVNNSGNTRWGLILRYQDPQNYYLACRQTGSNRLVIYKVANGIETVLASHNYSAPVSNEFFRLEAVADGPTISLKLMYLPSGAVLDSLSVNDAAFNQGSAGVFVKAGAAASARIDNVIAKVTKPIPSNHPPTAEAGADRIVEVGVPVNFNGGASSDQDGDMLTYLWIFGDEASGTGVSVNHTYARAGKYTASLLVSDDRFTDIDSVEVRVTTVSNTAPTLNPIGNKTIAEGQALSFVVSASDPENNPLTFSATNLPAGASFDPATKIFSWTPSFSQEGTYNNITFTVSDGTLTNSETISITVSNVGQPPVLAAIGNKTVNEGALLSFTLSATDPDGDPLTYSATGLPSGAAFNASTKTFSWTPTLTQSGTYNNITFTVSDGALTDSETISITVNNVSGQAPVLATIGNKSVNEGELLSFMVSASDADGDPLTYSASGLPSGAVFNTSTKIFNWTPTLTQFGTYNNIIFTVSDGALTDSETISITVNNSINNAPVLAAIGNKTVNEGVPLSFTLSATDLDLNPLTYSVSGLPSGAAFNPAARTFSWTPAFNQAGSYSVTFTVSDGSLSDQETITITVKNVGLSITALTDSPNLFSPNGDGKLETTTISSTFNHTASWTLQLKLGTTVVRTFTGSGTSLSQVWDGKNASGAMAADGLYTYTVTANDGGTPVTKSSTVTKDSTAPVLSAISDSPDPFKPSLKQRTTISYSLSEQSHVTLQIYNSGGALIKTVLNNILRNAGANSATWDGRNASSAFVPAGIYTYKVFVEDKAQNRPAVYPATGTVTVQ